MRIGISRKPFSVSLISTELHRTIYRVYDEKMGITRESVHVTFNEKELPCKKQPDMSDYAPMEMSQMERQQLTEELEVEQDQQQQQQQEQQTMAQQQAPVGAQELEVGSGGRPMRERRPPSYLTDDYEVNYAFAAAVRIQGPKLLRRGHGIRTRR